MESFESGMNKHVVIIAEAGVNHNGDLSLAKRMVDVAADAGADFIKFQTFNSELLAVKALTKAPYQISENHAVESQFEMLKKLEMSHEAHRILMSYCSEKSIGFLSTAFDLESLKFLSDLDLEYVKIPSGEITNLPFLRVVGSLGKKVILSTGMSTISEIRAALNALIISGAPKESVTILHCCSEYPAPMHDINLLAMNEIRDCFDVNVGYSDHSLGIEIPIAAVAIGAVLIEKHFTLDRSLQGPDHAASLTPGELKSMVSAIRNIEIALGDGKKAPSNSELKNIYSIRKSIVAKVKIRKGEIFSDANIIAKRAGNGISPMHWDDVIGSISSKDYEIDDLIKK